MTRDEIIDRTGAEDWNMVAAVFTGMDIDAIEETLDELFQMDDNAELAQAIADELS